MRGSSALHTGCQRKTLHDKEEIQNQQEKQATKGYCVYNEYGCPADIY